ncbi:lysophospholipid acyltransferase family protein [Agaribacterium haliotis]|uniref:lysophospholipid acyltransferase family protein n=1 Tax=Agaribacterium haliotis TaxID=2013869 RepID=UPI000BB5997E|nr:lysophospholipid acyltransferase family protein [Agaribacterium haliotis]
MASVVQKKLSYAVLKTLGSMPLSWARAIGAGLGHVAWALNGRERWVTERNIELCFASRPLNKRRDLAKASLIETAKLSLEMLVVWRRDQAWLQARIKKIDGQELVSEALEQGKGLIVLGPHLGNWEVLGKYIPRYAPVSSLYQPPKQVLLEEFIKNSREASGAQLVPTNKRGVAALLGRLKAGEMTGILPDQVPDEGGEFSGFFGHQAYTMTLIHGLLKRTQCKAVMAFAKRVDGGFELHFRKPDENIYSAELSESLEALNKSVEALVQEAPAQYQWEYKRFKKQPVKGDGKKLYAR